MNWLRWLLGRRRPQESDTAFWIYVRCRRCHEAIRVRADRRYDLASEWREAGESGAAYRLHKDIVGERCFQRMSVDLAFDHRLQIIERHIAGGDLLSEAEYTLGFESPPSPPPGAQRQADQPLCNGS